MENYELVMTSEGIGITSRDLACYLAIIGALPCDLFDDITSKIHDPDELEMYISAYDKARLAYHAALGRRFEDE